MAGIWLGVCILKGMSADATTGLPPATGNAPYPTTASGKRNWSWHAVHGNMPIPSKDTLPDQPGGFGELLDIINPLQHIPGVSSIYRAVTGDTISPTGRIIGGTLFGGPVGFLTGVGSTLIAETTGKDVGEHILASVLGGTNASNSVTSIGQAAAHYDSASRLRL